MALFSGLSEKLNHVFSKLANRGKLTALEIKEAMREVRVALLEADVNFMVAKEFCNKVSEKALGDEVLQSLTPSQQVIKIVNEELVALMSSPNQKLQVSPKPPTIIMMCGLQGAGKTTMCAKLAAHLKKVAKDLCLLRATFIGQQQSNNSKLLAKRQMRKFLNVELKTQSKLQKKQLIMQQNKVLTQSLLTQRDDFTSMKN